MANVQNEICNPTYLRDLMMSATQAFSMIYSASQWTGGTPPEFPDIYLPLRLYNGSGCHYDQEMYWDDAFDWTTVALMSYVGIPEHYRRYHSRLVTDFANLFPHFSGLPTLTVASSDDGSPFISVDDAPITNIAWFQKHWLTGASLIAGEGICPSPSSTWHGSWPGGYKYNTLPELQNAFGVVAFLGGVLLPLNNEWQTQNVQTWQVFHYRNRGYSFAGSGPDSNVEDWESADALVDMTAFIVNDTSGFVPIDVACTAQTAGGTPFSGDHDCFAQVKVMVTLRGYGMSHPGQSGQVSEYVAQFAGILNNADPNASLALGMTHADLQGSFPANWTTFDSSGRPLMSPYSVVKIDAEVEGSCSVLSRTTAPSGASHTYNQQQTIGGSYAHLRIGPYEYECSA